MPLFTNTTTDRQRSARVPLTRFKGFAKEAMAEDRSRHAGSPSRVVPQRKGRQQTML
jgi:hypothetical protein